MKRAVVVALALITGMVVSSPAAAIQDPRLPTVDFSVSLTDNLDDAGLSLQASAGVWYLGDLFTDGPARLFFNAYRFETDEAASAAMPIILAYQCDELDAGEHGDLVSLSPIGDEHIALLVTRDGSSGTGTAHIVIRSGAIVAYAQTFGGLYSTDNPIAVLVPYLQGISDRIGSLPHETDDDLQAILPTYDLLPGGLTEMEAPGADFSASPTPTPLVAPPGDGFTFSGTGDLSTRIEVTEGTYRVTATCSDPKGSVQLFAAADFDTTLIPPSGVILEFQGAPADALLWVSCDGNWGVTGTAP